MGQKQIKASVVVKLLIGSVLGLLLFVIPLPWNGSEKSSTMLLSWMKTKIQDGTEKFWLIACLVFITISFLGCVYMLITKNKEHSKFMKGAFKPSAMNLVLRAIAVIVSFMAYFSLGPEWISGPDTGGMMFEMMPSLVLFFYLGTILLYFLTDYGLMEFVGSLVARVFRPLFRLPGRAAVLCVSAFFGSGTVQILATDQEYRSGYLTAREANIVELSFCTITFGAMFAYTVSIGGLQDTYWTATFIAAILTAIIAGIVMSRIPPISLSKDTYYNDNKQMYDEKEQGFIVGARLDYDKASKAPNFFWMCKNGGRIATSIILDVLPMVVALGTIVLALAYFTPVFDWIGTPFVPLLQAIGVPEAKAVAPSLFTGFADLLIPFFGAAALESQLAKFIVCVVGISQVICMTETGMIISKAAAPLNVGKLFVCFLEKTVIALFVALLIGKLMGIPA